MLEFPEVNTIAAQLRENVCGRRVKRVLPPTKPHKFCWFNGDPTEYDAGLRGSVTEGAEAFGIYVEICFDNGRRLCFNDGVNLRLISAAEAPKEFQLSIEFEDGDALIFTVAMYGGIVLHAGDYENEYYQKSRNSVSPLSDAFESWFRNKFAESKPNLSAKAFLATEQRFPGIGNGVTQDILLAAGIHPKRKIGTLSERDADELLYAVRAVLSDMTERGGRDTERDLFGRSGRYRTNLCKNTLKSGCPLCGNPIVKENYLGGAVYYCPVCQPLERE